MEIKGLRFILILSVLAVSVSLALSGCSTLGSAMSNALGKQAASNATSSQPSDTSSGSGSTAKAPSPAAAQAYQYQFNAFYGGFWNFGWFGYKDPNYKPGQGTVWKITSTGAKSNEPITFERALLKVNADGSQWWRFQMTTDKHTILYEFLVGSDGIAKKVRYKDPESGQIGEFIPTQSGTQPTAPQVSREEIASSFVGSESVTVPAGTFTADHYRYTDPKSGYTSDIWSSKQVPGYMVKFTGTNPKDNRAANGQLIQIESGVTTALSSF